MAMTGRTGQGREPVLRAATPPDLPAMLGLATAFYAEDGFTTPEAELRRNLEHLVGSDAAHAVVADDNSDVVAFAITTTGFGLENGLIAELEDLYVVPARRRQGIATRLIDESAQWSRRLGCRRLELVIAPNGLDVQHLHAYYAARGFRDDGRRLIHRDLDG